jgi:DNA-binding PadR family transcriptional regulator
VTVSTRILLNDAPQGPSKEGKVVLGRLDVILLKLLSLGDRTGYDVWKWLELHGPGIGYTARTPQIYSKLQKFAEWGWVQPIHDPRDSGPDAKLYQLTDEGRRKLSDWSDSPYVPSRRPLDPDFQIRLWVAGSMSPEKTLQLVRTELEYRKRGEETADQIFDPSTIPGDASPYDRVWQFESHLIQQERGRYMVGSLIVWLQATERRLVALIGSQRA